MTIHEKHMELIDAVNNAKTLHDHWTAYSKLNGWREGMRDAGFELDLIACDLTQFNRGFEARGMCCGVFSDWKESL